MKHPFFATAATRTEALRWLTISEKLLAAHDLLGSKSFAARAHDSDPTLSQADQILAIVDTLLAAEHRTAGNHPDWYKILRLTPPQGRDAGLVSGQYRRLVLLLNPQTNKFPLAEQAFRLVFDAYSVLSDPSRRSLYDKDLAFHSQPNPFSDPMPGFSHNFISFGGGGGVIQSSGAGGSHPVQVQQAHVEPVVGGSTQNFMGSGYNLVFGSGSGSKSGFEVISNQVHSSYGVDGNVVSEQLNHLHKQSLQNSSSPRDETIHNVSVTNNVGENIETMEDKEDVEVVDVTEEEEEETEEEEMDPVVGEGSTFWTACPYCYYMYEYPHVYVDCTLKCQKCKRAFQAVVIPSPPPIVEGQEGYFCCWGFLPLGFSMEDWQKCNAGASGWAPFTPFFGGPQGGDNVKGGVGGGEGDSAPRDYGDDDSEDFVAISEPSEDWQDDGGKKGEGVDNGKAPSVEDGVELPKKRTSEASKMGSGGKRPAGWPAKKLDLNVELSVESEEPAMRMRTRTNKGNRLGRGEDDNIEGNGFFEGLDEFLSSLPILNVVGEEKAVKAAY